MLECHVMERRLGMYIGRVVLIRRGRESQVDIGVGCLWESQLVCIVFQEMAYAPDKILSWPGSRSRESRASGFKLGIFANNIKETFGAVEFQVMEVWAVSKTVSSKIRESSYAKFRGASGIYVNTVCLRDWVLASFPCFQSTMTVYQLAPEYDKSLFAMRGRYLAKYRKPLHRAGRKRSNVPSSV